MKQSLIFILLLLLITLQTAAQKNSSIETITGQIVCCKDCWVEEDRTKVEFGTAEDLLKAKSCVEGGDPTLIAVRRGDKFTLYELALGKFKPTGGSWLSYVGKKVSATGSTKKNNVFEIDSLKILELSIGEREAKAAIGAQVDLKLKDLFGADQSLGQYKGRIVILNFWATYCEPCREEMPDLASIQNDFAAFGVQVIGASADELSDRPKVLEFIRETRINFPIWMGASAADMSRFGLGGALPGTVVIDQSGKIVNVISGMVNAAELRNLIEDLLKKAESKVVPTEPVARKEKTKPDKTDVSSVPS